MEGAVVVMGQAFLPAIEPFPCFFRQTNVCPTWQMPRVFIPAQLRDLTTSRAEIEVAGGTVRELVAALDERFPGMNDRLCLNGELSPVLQVSIDGEFSRRGLDARVKPTSEVHFLPVFGGG
jgi:molybdopterin converting factor small subunit